MTPDNKKPRKSYDDYTWCCVECGYEMNSAICVDDVTKRARENDLTICMECTHLYVRHADKWVEPTVDEYLSFPLDVKQRLEKLRKACKAVKI